MVDDDMQIPLTASLFKDILRLEADIILYKRVHTEIKVPTMTLVEMETYRDRNGPSPRKDKKKKKHGNKAKKDKKSKAAKKAKDSMATGKQAGCHVVGSLERHSQLGFALDQEQMIPLAMSPEKCVSQQQILGDSK